MRMDVIRELLQKETTMNKKIIMIAICTSALFISTSALAGKWVTGKGETIQAAIESAIFVGEARVRSRTSGCVDGKQRGLKQIEISGVKIWEIQVLTHNHNGSCGIDANAEWAKSVAADLAKAVAK